MAIYERSPWRQRQILARIATPQRERAQWLARHHLSQLRLDHQVVQAGFVEIDLGRFGSGRLLAFQFDSLCTPR